MKAQEIYEQVTNQLIARIEQGDNGTWRCPWHHDANSVSTQLPTNASTGKHYQGGNVIALWITAEVEGYPTGVWATYKQWAALGAQVRKGEKGTFGVKWVFPTEADRKKREAQGKRSSPWPAGFTLFNAAQVDGWTPPDPIDTGVSPVEAAEAFFDGVGARVVREGNRAFYDRLTDKITVPPIRQYDEPADFYATLAHEHTHWTSHKDRCDRQLGTRFGDDTYAFEELIAELGAAFTTALLGLANEPRPDHAQYLTNWLKVLRSDSKALFQAASLAQKAVDFLVAASGGEEAGEAVEPELVSA